MGKGGRRELAEVVEIGHRARRDAVAASRADLCLPARDVVAVVTVREGGVLADGQVLGLAPDGTLRARVTALAERYEAEARTEERAARFGPAVLRAASQAAAKAAAAVAADLRALLKQ